MLSKLFICGIRSELRQRTVPGRAGNCRDMAPMSPIGFNPFVKRLCQHLRTNCCTGSIQRSHSSDQNKSQHPMVEW